jgi:ABC-type multidrug transport system ATPase subunit
VRQPDIVLLDEPYTGLDALTRRGLRSLVENWIREGRTILIATHHCDDWPRGAACELELAAGRPLYCGPLRTFVTARPRARA